MSRKVSTLSKRILVTGSTGYIGSHLCKLLKEHGYYVEGWDCNIHGKHNDISRYCDVIRNYDITLPMLNLNGKFHAVVHLAGRSVVPQSLLEPTDYYRVNVMGTSNLIEHVSTDHFIFASTSSAWEMASPYARSKVAAEDVIKEKANGYTIFRFFNVSGTDGINAQLGPATHLIRVAAMAAAGKLPNVSIFGTDYDTPDGTCIRDYIHVVDLAHSIIKSIKHGPANTPYECLGSNQGYSVREVIQTMKDVTRQDFEVIEVERREGDAVKSIVDETSQFISLKMTLQDMCLDQYIHETKER